MSSSKHWLPVCLVLLLLIGCSPTEVSPDDVTPYLLPTLPPSLESPPNDLVATQVEKPVTVNFLFPSEPICDLPCWHDISPGQTKVEQFEKKIGPLNSDRSSSTGETTEGYPMTAHVWLFGDQRTPNIDRLRLATVINPDTETIDLMHLNWSGPVFSSAKITPATIIQELGRPDQILLHVQSVNREGDILAENQLLLLYEIGIIFDLGELSSFSDIDGIRHLEICLNGDDPNDYIGTASAYLVPSFDYDDFISLEEPTARFALQRQLTFSDYEPFEERTNATIEDFTEVAMQEGDACFTVELNSNS